jgi:hypothetical protein
VIALDIGNVEDSRIGLMIIPAAGEKRERRTHEEIPG